MRHPRLSRRALGIAATALCAVSAGAAANASAASPSASPTVTVVARGLNVPKYLQFGPGGLYVAESGRGGPRCIRGVGTMTTATTICAGATGSIARITASGARTVLSGLPSTVEKDTGEVLGPIAVTFRGRRPVVLLRDTLVGPAGTSAVPDPFGPELGKLAIATPRRVDVGLRTVGDIARFAAHHPQPAATLGGLPGETVWDSDPHDVVRFRGGYAVADAGANAVFWVHANGRISVIARLPTQTETAPAGALGPVPLTIQAQSVPSSLTVGPDGALYVGLLRGIPSLPGTAQVDRVVPGQAPTVAVSGLTRVSDLAFDGGDRLLVLESNTGGALAPKTTPGALLAATVVPGQTVTASDLGVSGLIDPTGLAVGPAGAAYVTNDTGVPGQGQVLRIAGLG